MGKIQFIKLDISNWRIAKNQMQIDREIGQEIECHF
jgi:hypothetical protein